MGDARGTAEKRLHAQTAAGAAVAYSVETVVHGILEPGGVNMAPLLFCLNDLQRLVHREASCFIRVVFHHKRNNRLTHDDADIAWLAGIFLLGAARAVHGSQAGQRVIKDDAPGNGIGDDMLEFG